MSRRGRHSSPTPARGEEVLALVRAEIADFDRTVELEGFKELDRAAKVLAKQGRPADGDEKGSGATFTTTGRGSAYLTARLKRDHKDISDRLACGEFMSRIVSRAEPECRESNSRPTIARPSETPFLRPKLLEEFATCSSPFREHLRILREN
jgi:hypothetical protein